MFIQKENDKSNGEDDVIGNFKEEDGISNEEDGGIGNFEEEDDAKSNGENGGIENFEEEDGDKGNDKDGGIEDYDEEGDETNGEDGENEGEVADENEKGGEQNEGGDRNRNYTEDNIKNQAGERLNDAISSVRVVKKVNSAKEKMESNYNQSIDISLGMAIQVLSEFAGESCARKWITQMYNIASIYGITGHYVKMLMVSKIKGKANVWLHANSGRVLFPLEELTAELISMFGEKTSKLEIRRKFENRKWSTDEAFGSYADDKVMLAQGINMDAEEMLGCIIEGIPNQGLRNQTLIQCFVDVGHIKRAFADVSLHKSLCFGMTTPVLNFKDNKETRCYNCNGK